MSRFPAIVIGGPPDSGKSVLTANLTQALRERGIEHYVLRACPDGEGDWTYLADWALVRTIRIPRRWTPRFVELVCRDLERRHLPLIVDAGGRPQPWQEAIFERCTHAILLYRADGTPAGWDKRIIQHNLQLVADLRSDLHGESRILCEQPVLHGVLAGLQWDRAPQERDTIRPDLSLLSAPIGRALVDRVAALFDYDRCALIQAHYDAAPVETVVDLDRLARALHVAHRGEQPTWCPDHLPAVLDYLPSGIPLGLYGRGPNWLYAALALLAYPAELWQFDVRLGWVQPVRLMVQEIETESPLQAIAQPGEECTELAFSVPTAYLDYTQVDRLTAPPLLTGKGVLISGKLPHWLLTSLVLAYRRTYPTLPWLAVYQPHVGGAVVVYSPEGDPVPGSVRRCFSTMPGQRAVQAAE